MERPRVLCRIADTAAGVVTDASSTELLTATHTQTAGQPTVSDNAQPRVQERSAHLPATDSSAARPDAQSTATIPSTSAVSSAPDSATGDEQSVTQQDPVSHNPHHLELHAIIKDLRVPRLDPLLTTYLHKSNEDNPWGLSATNSSTSPPQVESATPEPPRFAGCRIAIIDTAELGQQLGLPVCDPDTLFSVEANSAVLKLNASGLQTYVPLPHHKGQHAGPWYLYHAIKSSNLLTQDLEAADVVFVYDYCYYSWWNAYAHSEGQYEGKNSSVMAEYPNPGEYNVRTLHELAKLPRWTRNHGADFVFFEPHPDFYQHSLGAQFVDLRCNAFTNATFLVVERSQRYRCKGYKEHKTLIVPYSATQEDLDRVPARRDTLLFFKGKCRGDASVGKRMRAHVVMTLGEYDDPDLALDCTDLGQWSEGDHRDLIHHMHRSVFCFVMPGDSQSSRRITEIIDTGCIPVFLGPPFHTLPIAEFVDYQAAGIFVNLTDSDAWMGGLTVAEELDLSKAAHSAGDAMWWVLDDRTVTEFVVLPTAGLVDYLREIPKWQIAALQDGVRAIQTKFAYDAKMAQDLKHAALVDVMVEFMCRQSNPHNGLAPA